MDNAFNFPLPDIGTQIYAIVPVGIVALMGILALIVEMVKPKQRNDTIVLLSIAGLSLAAFVLASQLQIIPDSVLSDAVYRDPFGTSLQLVIVIATGLCVLFSEPYLRTKAVPFGEFYPLVLWSAAGAMLMASTRNLLVIFIGLEILSIALYVMAGLSKREQKSEESAMKYFLLGSFATAFLLFGIALMYGGMGTLNLEDVALAWTRNLGSSRLLLVMGLAMMLMGLGFKASLVPFHQWTPDVYEGAPTNVSAYMATTAKIAAFGALWRILLDTAVMREIWLVPLSVVAGLTMLVGNLVALTQTDLKRILAYSSIANAGYVLVGIIAGTSDLNDRFGTGVQYFLLSYVLMTIGAFAVISLFSREGSEATSLQDLNGLWKRSPLAAAVLVLCMLSLIGIPPTAGFFGKFLIFQDALRAEMVPLALVLAVSSVISVYYYLRIAAAAFTAADESIGERMTDPNPSVKGTLVAAGFGIAALSLLYGPVMRIITPELPPPMPGVQIGTPENPKQKPAAPGAG